MEGSGNRRHRASRSLAVAAAMAVVLALTVAVAPGAGASASPDRLASGESLADGQSLTSADGGTILALQTDGNLVLKRSDGTVRWNSATAGHAGDVLTMQADGNLVLADTDHTPLWSAGTAGHPGAIAVVRDPGDLGVVGTDGTTLWATDTATRLDPGTTLEAGRRLRSPDGHTSLTMQTDGNLVLIGATGKVAWAADTSGHPGARLSLQPDGNLVVFDVDDDQLWSTGTSNQPTLVAMVRDVGDLALVAPSGRSPWTTGTATRLDPGQTLDPGQRLRSIDQRSTLTMLPGGNAMLVGPDGLIWWTTGTGNHTGAVLTMQPGGDLVLQTRARARAWHTKTDGHPGAAALLGNDGRLVVQVPGGTVLFRSPSGPPPDNVRIPIAQRNTSSKGAAFIKSYEGYSATAYNDADGNCTVGWGHLIHYGNCTGTDLSTHWDTTALFAADVAEHEGRLDRALPNVPVYQWEFDALISYVYNHGSITASSSPQLFAALNAHPPKYSSVPGILRSLGGSLCGIQRRRDDEAQMFATADYTRDYPPCRSLSTAGAPPDAGRIPSTSPTLTPAGATTAYYDL